MSQNKLVYVRNTCQLVQKSQKIRQWWPRNRLSILGEVTKSYLPQRLVSPSHNVWKWQMDCYSSHSSTITKQKIDKMWLKGRTVLNNFISIFRLI